MKTAAIISSVLLSFFACAARSQDQAAPALPSFPPAPGAAPAKKDPVPTGAPASDREAVLRNFLQASTNKTGAQPPSGPATPAAINTSVPTPGVPASPVPPSTGSRATQSAGPPAFPQLPTPPATRTPRATPVGGPTTPAVPGRTTATPNAATPAAKLDPDAAADELLKDFNSDNPPSAEEDPEGFMSLFKFNNMPLDQFLDVVYASYTGKTILRSATLPAVQINLKAQSPLNKKEIVEALDSVLALNGISMIPTGEKFITAVPAAQALQEGAAFKDRKSEELAEASQYVTQIVQLKHVNPVDAQAIISPFAKNPAGIVVIEQSRILVLRDYSINVKRMLELIEKIDVFVPIDIQPEVIPIKYALAGDISSVLSSLTSGGGGGAASVGGTGGLGRSSRSRGAGRSGTGIGGAGGQVNQFGGQNQGATGLGAQGAGRAGAAGGSFNQRLQQIVSRAANAGELQILGDVKILPDERTNSLLVFANKQDMEMITNIIGKLDIVLQQVLIEAIIMEVSTDNGRSLGVSYRQRPKNSGKFTGVGGVNNGQGFLSTFPNLGAGGTGAATDAASASSSLPGGFSYFGQFAGNFDFALQAIADDSSINVLQRPRIQTSHAVPASFFVGETVPTVTGSSYGDFGGLGSGYGSRNSYQQLRVGVQLDVVPLINPDGLVVMEIQQKIDQLGPPVKIDNNDVPTTTSREANATVAVRDRDTIILGGFIKADKQGNKSGVPILKDVPLLGALFRSSSNRRRQTEMVVLMRPTVLPTPESAAQAASADRRRMTPEIRRAELEYQLDKEERNRVAEEAAVKAEKKKRK